ncbi:MAG: 30S ribosomal protein S12 methylthiotransferase RimO [Clostridiales bacterium]|nr:30S ribosomal protein S12 methylthiotransferase RimO [Clostridiales bacterium]
MSINNRPTVFLLSLGCSKNQVDSEGMRGLIAAQGWTLCEDVRDAQVIIVNTCGFIRPAKEESILSLLELARYKQQGCCRLLIAVGCLVEKYRDELVRELPEVDAFLGSREYGRIAALIAGRLCLPPAPIVAEQALFGQRLLMSPPYLAYLKIAEGCDNHCSYCLIPQLRGHYKSRPMEDILGEASALARRGVKELVLLAQDSTAYGLDISCRRLLPQLLTELARLPFLWIRLLYAYPDGVDEKLLAVMSMHDNICKYLDMPLQHGDDRILQAMGRRMNRAQLLERLALIRAYMPGASLRTTMMVGFPGEDAAAFANLLGFLRKARFDWIGVFPYYREEDTPAYDFPAQVAEEDKQLRVEQVLEFAAHITAERQKRHVGRVLTVLVESPADEEYAAGWWRGRAEYQAPEVDGAVYFPAHDIYPGDILPVRITGSETFDLIGEIARGSINT